jgi:hypothetical protein
MNEVQTSVQSNNPKCYTRSSERFKIYFSVWLCSRRKRTKIHIVVFPLVFDTLRHRSVGVSTAFFPTCFYHVWTIRYHNPEYHSLGQSLVFGVHVSFLFSLLSRYGSSWMPWPSDFFISWRVSNKNACLLDLHEFNLYLLRGYRSRGSGSIPGATRFCEK